MDTSRLDADPGKACFSNYDFWKPEFGAQKRCHYGDVITKEKRDLLRNKLLPQAAGFLGELLSVHRVQGKLRLGTAHCGYEGGVDVPMWMRTDGLDDADFVVFVTMR